MDPNEFNSKNDLTKNGSPPLDIQFDKGGKVTGDDTPPIGKRQILKNVLVLSLGFLCLFTSFQALVNLQSTLNSIENIGLISMSVLYAALILSCLFLPPTVISLLGCKWTVALSMITYGVYVAGNFYPEMWMMIVVSIIVGLGAAPLWSAKCAYLTELGIWYSKLTSGNADATINRFFGFFFMTFQTSQIWGNLISSLVLATPNATALTTNYNICGPVADPTMKLDNFNSPHISQVYTMKGIYLAFCGLAFLIICLFLDNIRFDKEKNKRQFGFRLLQATARHCWSSFEQKLLIPLTIYSGVEQAFILGTYTSAYVNCTLGIWNVGFIMISFGVVDAICSFSFGRLVKWVGHAPFFLLAALVHGGLQIGLLNWQPNPDQIVIFYVISGLWGMGDAVIQTQINALYGFLFSNNTEAAFANYRLWESVGFLITFAYSGYLRTDVKLYICIGFLVVGMLGYVGVEIYTRLRNKRAFNVSQVAA